MIKHPMRFPTSREGCARACHQVLPPESLLGPVARFVVGAICKTIPGVVIGAIVRTSIRVSLGNIHKLSHVWSLVRKSWCKKSNQMAFGQVAVEIVGQSLFLDFLCLILTKSQHEN